MQTEDSRWLRACAALAGRGRPLSRPNPSVGAIIVKDGIVVARGWTQAGGRPHAEAIALDLAGKRAEGATLYVSLEPCAHESPRGPACAALVAVSDLAGVVVGIEDPDPRTAGQGIGRIRDAGIAVRLADDLNCRNSLAGFVLQKTQHRPHVTLKLAVTADGYIARADGTSKWITGEVARAHVHMERARCDAILVGGGTFRADNPRLDVRLPGLEDRSPKRLLLTRGSAPEGWEQLASPEAIDQLEDIQYLFVEGGAGVADAFLSAGLVDRILLYRAPVTFGEGLPAFRNRGAEGLPDGWTCSDMRQLGSDTLHVYERA